jgi:rare lipoprotein A
VVVRVNDRGPFFPGRVIDLSYAAAYRLGISERGSGEVEVQAILPPEVLAAAPLPAVAPTPAPVEPPVVAVSETGYAVQLGAFASYVNAQNFLAHVSPSLVSLGNDAKVRQLNGLFRVYLGPYPTRDEARRTADALRDSLGLASTIAVH